MTTKDPGLAWLEREHATAAAEFYGETEDIRAYWQGYADAITNAMAALYGPTPLLGEDGEQ
jgi:hypothetical protein